MRRYGRDDRVIARPSLADQARPQYAVWSRDGQTIYFKAAESDNRAGIWAVPAGGGSPQLMVRLDDPQRPSLRREFATDGTRFFSPSPRTKGTSGSRT
jgi:hypothetical protein